MRLDSAQASLRTHASVSMMRAARTEPDNRCEGLFACNGLHLCLRHHEDRGLPGGAELRLYLGECVPETGECLDGGERPRPLHSHRGLRVDAGTCNDEGACEGPEIDRDDGDPCTIDSCDREGGCVHTVDQGEL